MTDPVDTLLLDVRANTQGFADDVAAMRGAFDGTLVDGFGKAGQALERGLLGAIKRGSLGFEDLKRVALGVIDQIAAQAMDTLFAAIGGIGGAGGGVLNFSSLFGAVLGLPGRATGGPVSPGRGYLVGEQGPELFVPTSAGRIEAPSRPAAMPALVPSAALPPPPRDVRVSITLNAPAGTAAPQALQRSSRQVASAVRRALNSI